MDENKKNSARFMAKTCFLIFVFLGSTQPVWAMVYSSVAHETKQKQEESFSRYESEDTHGEWLKMEYKKESDLTRAFDTAGMSRGIAHQRNSFSFQNHDVSRSLFYSYFPYGNKLGGDYFGGGITGRRVKNSITSTSKSGAEKIDNAFTSVRCDLFTGYAWGFGSNYFIDARMGYARIMYAECKTSQNVENTTVAPHEKNIGYVKINLTINF
jgi:hypothetical protein